MFHVPPQHQSDPAKAPGQIIRPTPALVTTPDFRFSDHGSIVLLTALTEAARTWCAQHLPEDCPRMGYAYAIEKRFFGNILDGIDADGFQV